MASDLAPSSERDVDWILEQLAAGCDKLPRDAIQEARKRGDEVIPRLIDTIQRAAADAREGRKVEGNAHFFALFLLTEFKAKEALPVILEAVSLPGDLPFDLFGDAVTSTLNRTFAALAGDQVDLIDSMIADRVLNRYVRWGAADALTLLVRDGRMARDEALERLHRQLREAVSRDDDEVAVALVLNLADLGPADARETIEKAYETGLVDPFIIRLDEVDQAIAGGEQYVQSRLSQLPSTDMDTVKELSHWASYWDSASHAQPKETRPLPITPPPAFVDPEPSPKTQRVGRNAPCPCGSGKKFKQCCMRKGRE